ncbi:hypothetical protein Lsan_3268 [Legionella santicrucis]|uniref:Uncharacterized protein n=1 Tax=Legionella santicrucis TaxID=45074 RepID=A0A0W0YGF0_9GAMM|nr:hypothetical protein [Legionella santicrucis]KTD55716.1 hypothetical protein Lsan_3268 [Legionella santicrucis]
MKKFFCSLGLSFCLASSVFASDSALDLLNSEITNILVPFQNQSTTAKLKFDAVEIDDERATNVILNGLYSKIGSTNVFNVTIDNLSYNYGDGKSPTTALKGSIGLDLTKFLTREESNRIIPSAIEFLQDLTKDYTEEYGDAVSVNGVVTSTTKDTDGNYTGLTALISAKIDLDKISDEQTRELVMVTDVVVSLTLNLKTGIAIDSYVISNPEYSGFKEDQIGLKEILERLLNRDEEVLEIINGLFMYFDYVASDIVEMDNSSFWKLLPKKHLLK